MAGAREGPVRSFGDAMTLHSAMALLAEERGRVVRWESVRCSWWAAVKSCSSTLQMDWWEGRIGAIV